MLSQPCGMAFSYSARNIPPGTARPTPKHRAGRGKCRTLGKKHGSFPKFCRGIFGFCRGNPIFQAPMPQDCATLRQDFRTSSAKPLNAPYRTAANTGPKPASPYTIRTGNTAFHTVSPHFLGTIHTKDGKNYRFSFFLSVHWRKFAPSY